jgi:phosphatidylserine/phosphatidylglycerophosphate/cardiolipin synthase-like enzyme
LKRSTSLFLILLCAALACSAVPTLAPPPTVTPVPVPPTLPASAAGLMELALPVGFGARGPFYEVYFTDPFNPSAFREEGGPDLPLVAAIDSARLSIEMAAYSLSLYSIQQALIRAQQRGVTVRLVMESDNQYDNVPQALREAGIPIRGDEREGLMHDKFVIIDRAEVWLGSLNFTTSGTYQDNNNLVRVRSSQLVENYLTEFEEMFTDDFFGPDLIAATPHPVLTVDGIRLENYFSPDDGVARRVVKLLRSAEKSIYFLAYSFTANDFGEILIEKARQGVTVAGVMEKDQVKSNTGTEFYPFYEAGLPVYLDGNPGQMHHKVFIIDEQIVITGSYNFSASAERTNDENILIIFDPRLAAQYLAEFQRVLIEAQK